MNENNCLNKNAVITVGADGSKQYRSVNDAVMHAYELEKDGSSVTIKVYPGVYREVVRIKDGHRISIIGTDKENCILRDDSGEYDNAPLMILGDGSVKNLTIIATHRDNRDFMSTRTDDYKIGSYALHIDGFPYNVDYPRTLTVENCLLYSEQNAAVGIGMQKNFTLIIKNCEMIKNMPDELYEICPNESDKGAFLIHRAFINKVTANGEYIPTPQRFVMDSCRVAVNRGYAMQLCPNRESIHGMSTCYVNNTIESGTNPPDNMITTFAEGYEISPESTGNNICALNCRKDEEN